MKIERLLRKGSSVQIFFDTAEKLIIAYEVALDSSLRKGDDLSDSEIFELKRKNELFQIKKTALNILQRRLHSKRELRTKLLKKKFDPKLIDSVIEYLEERKYLDEERMVEQFIHEKFEIRKNGANKIRAELIRKGIQREIIDKYIYTNITDDKSVANALELAEKRLPRLSKLESTKKKQRLFSFLSGRGYSQNIIFRVFSDLDLNE